MILSQFTVAHCYSKNSNLSMLVGALRARCKEICLETKEPKLGDHTTLLPPFRAHTDEMKQFSMGLDIAHALYGANENQSFGETLGVDFFQNPDIDALVVKVRLPRGYDAMIRKCREQLSGFNEWVFPVLGESYSPHLCILEGVELYQKLKPHIPELESLMPLTRFQLPFPKIMIKVVDGEVTRWQEFNAAN